MLVFTDHTTHAYIQNANEIMGQLINNQGNDRIYDNYVKLLRALLRKLTNKISSRQQNFKRKNASKEIERLKERE